MSDCGAGRHVDTVEAVTPLHVETSDLSLETVLSTSETRDSSSVTLKSVWSYFSRHSSWPATSKEQCSSLSKRCSWPRTVSDKCLNASFETSEVDLSSGRVVIGDFALGL